MERYTRNSKFTRDYYFISRCPELECSDKKVLAEITGLTEAGRTCHMSNEYLAEKIGLSQRAARYALRRLKKLGAITVRADKKGRTVHYVASIDYLNRIEAADMVAHPIFYKEADQADQEPQPAEAPSTVQSADVVEAEHQPTRQPLPNKPTDTATVAHKLGNHCLITRQALPNKAATVAYNDTSEYTSKYTFLGYCKKAAFEVMKKNGFHLKEKAINGTDQDTAEHTTTVGGAAAPAPADRAADAGHADPPSVRFKNWISKDCPDLARTYAGDRWPDDIEADAMREVVKNDKDLLRRIIEKLKAAAIEKTNKHEVVSMFDIFSSEVISERWFLDRLIDDVDGFPYQEYSECIWPTASQQIEIKKYFDKPRAKEFIKDAMRSARGRVTPETRVYDIVLPALEKTKFEMSRNTLQILIDRIKADDHLSAQLASITRWPTQQEFEKFLKRAKSVDRIIEILNISKVMSNKRIAYETNLTAVLNEVLLDASKGMPIFY